jgi:hypothetical protein
MQRAEATGTSITLGYFQNSDGTNNLRVSLGVDQTNKWTYQDSDYSNGGLGHQFRVGGNATPVGSYASSGAWVKGATAFVGEHTTYGSMYFPTLKACSSNRFILGTGLADGGFVIGSTGSYAGLAARNDTANFPCLHFRAFHGGGVDGQRVYFYFNGNKRTGDGTYALSAAADLMWQVVNFDQTVHKITGDGTHTWAAAGATVGHVANGYLSVNGGGTSAATSGNHPHWAVKKIEITWNANTTSCNANHGLSLARIKAVTGVVSKGASLSYSLPSSFTGSVILSTSLLATQVSVSSLSYTTGLGVNYSASPETVSLYIFYEA